MQPHFLPWLGYLNMIKNSDVFVVLDDVQLSYQSWQLRNRIRSFKGLEWISLSIENKYKFRNISDVFIKDSKQIDKIKNKIFQNYSKLNYYKNFSVNFFSLLDEIFLSKKLLEINLVIIKYLLSFFNIKTKIYLSSQMHIKKKKTEKLVEICKILKANESIFSPGSINYLDKDYEKFSNEKIKILIHEFQHPTYKQCFNPFIPYASSIDLILNEGKNAVNIFNISQFKLRNY